ncbi:MAG: glutamate--tRNA ligase family protein, partial [Synechococcus sp.]
VPAEDPEGSGDVVVRRADGFVAYQLATVLDDLRSGITDVVRGEDLREAEAPQRSVFAALNAAPPRFHYAPLVTDDAGQKLSKRDSREGLQPWIDRGADAADVIGLLAAGLGLVPSGTRCSARAVLHELT